MILVIGVRMASRHSLMIKVGQGSKSHDFVGDLDISSLHPLWLTVGRKEVKVRCSSA